MNSFISSLPRSVFLLCARQYFLGMMHDWLDGFSFCNWGTESNKQTKKKYFWDFPSGPVVGSLSANARYMGSISFRGRSHMAAEQLSPSATTTEAQRLGAALVNERSRWLQWEAVGAPQQTVGPALRN